jgi:hypothetical protein
MNILFYSKLLVILQSETGRHKLRSKKSLNNLILTSKYHNFRAKSGILKTFLNNPLISLNNVS